MKTRTFRPPANHWSRWRFTFVCLFVPLLFGCATYPDVENESFEAAPSRIDSRIETATIEDYIIALPPFAYHEESVRRFKKRVTRARVDESQNSGKELDSLYIGGDGTWPPKEFTLDRTSRTLTIHVLPWEPGVSAYTETMQRVPGGWLRGARKDDEEQHPEVRENPDWWVFMGNPLSRSLTGSMRNHRPMNL